VDLKQLNALRQRIREIEGRPAVQTRSRASGLACVDDVLGGLPQPGVVYLSGSRGSGVTRLALGMTAAKTKRTRVAWVDIPKQLYPPTAHAFGIDLQRLLLIRPSPERAGWAVEQVTRSGCFECVVVGLPQALMHFGPRWSRATQLGCSTLIVLGAHCPRDLSVDVRIEVQGEHAVVTRRRGGGVGQTLAMPPWPVGGSPWV
jgi:hypothetical protein